MAEGRILIVIYFVIKCFPILFLSIFGPNTPLDPFNENVRAEEKISVARSGILFLSSYHLFLTCIIL